jgi:hypothetical protein
MKIIFGVIQHIILVSVLLTIFTQHYFRIKHSADSVLLDRVITNITINLAMFTITNYMLSFVGVKTRHIYLGMIILILVLMVINSFLVSLDVLLSGIKSRIIPLMFIIGPALFISIWQYIPTLALLDSTASSLNMTSIGNNDIANYALAAKEYLNSGFTNSGRYPDMDFNSYARDLQHLTVHLLVSFTSFVSILPVWKIMNSVMIFTVALNAIVLIKLFKTINKSKNPVLPILAASLALLNPLNSYVIHHYFLSQSLSLFILILVIIKGYEIYNKRKLNLIDKIEISSIVILSIFSYPSILIPAIFGVFSINLVSEKLLKKEKLKSFAKKYFTVIIFGALGFAISIAYLPRALNILYLHATITSGWELPAPNAIGVFFSPFYISNGINESISKLIWFGLLIVIIVIISLNIISKKANRYFLFLISSIVSTYILQVIIRGQGFGHYQNWKLLSYILPIIIVFVVAEILKISHKTGLFLIPFLLAGLHAPKSLWKNGNEFGSPSVISNDLIDLISIKEKYGIDSLNVMIGPNYQSMAVGLVTDVNKIYFSSPTYYPLNSDDNSCSLIANSDTNFPNSVQVNDSYSLISSKSLKCNVVSKDKVFNLSDNVEYKFDDRNLKNRKLLDRGWSYPEKWGTWSEGEYSRMIFMLPEGHDTAGTLIIKSTFFVANDSEKSKVQVFMNGVILGNIPTTSNKNVIELDVTNFIKGPNVLEFIYSNVKSPKELKISEDNRLILLGISSLKIIEGS